MISDDDGVKPVHADGEILDRVYARARAIRRRKRAERGLSGFVVLTLVIGAAIGVSNLVATRKTPNALKPTVSPSPTTSVLGVTILPRVTAPAIGGAALGPAPHVKPSGPVCVNSFDFACGVFYWDPPPGRNAPVSISIHLSSTTVQAGEVVTATVTVSDPDAPIRCVSAEWGDNGTYIGTAIQTRVRHGRWETPPKHPSGVETHTYTHAYDNVGPHRFFYTVYTGTGGCGDVQADPYASSGAAGANITVIGPSPSPSGSPTPTPTPTPSPSDSVTPSPSAT